MKRLMRYAVVGAPLCMLAVLLVGGLPGCEKPTGSSNDAAASKGLPPCRAGKTEVAAVEEVVSCDGKNKSIVPKDAAGQVRADALLDQWKRNHPDHNWVEKEKEAHVFNPPADNSDVLTGGQGKDHVYGNFTETDVLIWARETEKMVAEGSRIFHNADLLGSTVGVSCDMCHPHASNTHPETYPKFQTQLGRVVLLRDMINWCIENPVRGKKLEADSPEMRALEAYIMAQRKGVEMNYGKN